MRSSSSGLSLPSPSSADSNSAQKNFALVETKGVDVLVKMPGALAESGHLLVVPDAYTFDKLKTLIFKEIGVLVGKNPNEYCLELKGSEHHLEAEFTKLRNIIAKEPNKNSPLEVVILSNKEKDDLNRQAASEARKRLNLRPRSQTPSAPNLSGSLSLHRGTARRFLTTYNPGGGSVIVPSVSGGAGLTSSSNAVYPTITSPTRHRKPSGPSKDKDKDEEKRLRRARSHRDKDKDGKGKKKTKPSTDEKGDEEENDSDNDSGPEEVFVSPRDRVNEEDVIDGLFKQLKEKESELNKLKTEKNQLLRNRAHSKPMLFDRPEDETIVAGSMVIRTRSPSTSLRENSSGTVVGTSEVVSTRRNSKTTSSTSSSSSPSSPPSSGPASASSSSSSSSGSSETKKEVKELKESLKAKDKTISDLKKELDERKDRMKKQGRKLKAKQAEKDHTEKLLQERKKEIERKEKELEAQENEIEKQAKYMEELSKELEEKESRLQSYKKQLAEMRKILEERDRVIAQLNDDMALRDVELEELVDMIVRHGIDIEDNFEEKDRQKDNKEDESSDDSDSDEETEESEEETNEDTAASESEKEKEKGKEKEKEKEKEREEKEADEEHEVERKASVDKEEVKAEEENKKENEKTEEKEKEDEKEREKEREKENESDVEKDKESGTEKEKERETDKENEIEREKEKDKVREREKDKDGHRRRPRTINSARGRRIDSSEKRGSDSEKERERDKEKEKDQEREKETEKEQEADKEQKEEKSSPRVDTPTPVTHTWSRQLPRLGEKSTLVSTSRIKELGGSGGLMLGINASPRVNDLVSSQRLQSPRSPRGALFLLSQHYKEQEEKERREKELEEEKKKQKLTPEQHAMLTRKEFIETEIIYTKNLNLIIQNYLQPLRTAAHTSERAEILTPSELDVLFPRELLTIQSMHQTFLADLQNPDLPFAETVLAFVPYLKIYTVYINNYSEASNLLIQLEDKTKFQDFLQETAERLDGPEGSQLDIGALLIMPVQRLPRYELLLRDIVKYTPDTSPNYSQIAKALESVKGVNGHVNESKRGLENTNKVLTIHSGLRKTPSGFSLFDRVGRKFIKEGVLQVKKLSTEEFAAKTPRTITLRFEKRYYFLFDDLLLETRLAKGGNFYKFKNSYHLNDLVFQRNQESSKMIVFMYFKGRKLVHLKAETNEEREAWMNSITSCILSNKNDTTMKRRGTAPVAVMEKETDEKKT